MLSMYKENNDKRFGFSMSLVVKHTSKFEKELRYNAS